jgi:hypothetical protein
MGGAPMPAKKVRIKEFGIDMEVKNKGVVLDVYEGGTYLGDIQVTKTGLTWCNGKSPTGPKVSWKEFIDWMNSNADGT